MKKYLLLVDDDLDLMYAVSRYLSNEGFSVISVSSGQDALKILQSKHIDLMVTDIIMPNLDGYDLIKLLRISPKFFNLPIIFLTAKGMTSDRIKAYDLGCSSYLTKPFDPNELLSIVRNLLKNSDVISESVGISQNNNQNKLVNSILTSKELAIFHLVYQGLMNKEIAVKLNLNLRTVEKYVSRLLTKSNTRNRTELVKFALTNNLFDSRANDGNRTRE
uniref:Ycf29 n=1 Tax=Pterocladia lucida TaxID=31408 RepID=A0A6M3WWB7_PTELU|nr:Ycf29 [Pterocladia lucida]